MKLIKVRTTVTVTDVDDRTHEPRYGAKPDGFMVGDSYFAPDNAPDGAIDREVQRMLVGVLPAAYVESDKRWARP